MNFTPRTIPEIGTISNANGRNSRGDFEDMKTPIVNSKIPRPQVLDACCGSRMFWFDRSNPDVVFVDKRRERHHLKDSSSKHGERTLVIDPDVVGDFTHLPFQDSRFAVVVFDPPHLLKQGDTGWLAKKYGKLRGDWKVELRSY